MFSAVCIVTRPQAGRSRVRFFTGTEFLLFLKFSRPSLRLFQLQGFVPGSRVETESGGTRKRTGGEVKGKKANGGGSQQSCPVSDTVHPALLALMRILRLLAAD